MEQSVCPDAAEQVKHHRHGARGQGVRQRSFFHSAVVGGGNDHSTGRMAQYSLPIFLGLHRCFDAGVGWRCASASGSTLGRLERNTSEYESMKDPIS